MKLILIAVNSYWHYISWLLLTSVDVSRYIRNRRKKCARLLIKTIMGLGSSVDIQGDWAFP